MRALANKSGGVVVQVLAAILFVMWLFLLLFLVFLQFRSDGDDAVVFHAEPRGVVVLILFISTTLFMLSGVVSGNYFAKKWMRKSLQKSLCGEKRPLSAVDEVKEP